MSVTDEAAERVARAVLYEGYLLYPYRASSTKNQHRWGFGVLYPEGYSTTASDGSRSELRGECVVAGDGPVSVTLRFLDLSAGNTAVERETVLAELRWEELEHGVERALEWPGPDGGGGLRALLQLSATRVSPAARRLGARVCNRTAFTPRGGSDHRAAHDAAMAASLASAHLVVAIDRGRFASAQDPTESLREAVAGCRNEGVWPVLLGDPARADTMLFTPIALEDYPRVAPESPGDLYDATEIDEILTLRLLTLTDEEKAAVRAGDPRARALLDRAESLGPDELAALHGARRDERRARDANGEEISKGSRVRIRPGPRADALDVCLRGMAARVVGLEQDFEGRVFACVVIEDDPGKDLGEAGMPGHRFYFRPEELEAWR